MNNDNVKNIIFDVGGIIFDDSEENIEKVLKKECGKIYKLAYGKGFKECLKGKVTVKEYINSFKENEHFEDIKYILTKENLNITYPLMKENFEYIKTLKDKGYKLYLLTNITEDSYNYIKNIIDIDKVFNGGVYTFKEGIIKPQKEIYEIILNRFKLKKEDTIFFDDKIKNIEAAKEIGINGYVFKKVDDIKNKIEKR